VIVLQRTDVALVFFLFPCICIYTLLLYIIYLYSQIPATTAVPLQRSENNGKTRYDHNSRTVITNKPSLGLSILETILEIEFSYNYQSDKVNDEPIRH
jgi:hypothetical protein